MNCGKKAGTDTVAPLTTENPSTFLFQSSKEKARVVGFAFQETTVAGELSSSKGVSAEYIRMFIEQHLEGEFEDMQTWQMVEDLIKPTCAFKKAALVDCIEQKYCQTATVFVSHAYSYRTRDVMQVMLEYEETHPNSFFWFDPFSLCQIKEPQFGENQDKVIVSTELLEKAFGDQIKAIGSVLIVASPWDNPAFLCRAWCLFELYMAANQKVITTTTN